jgi:hypothetical protein
MYNCNLSEMCSLGIDDLKFSRSNQGISKEGREPDTERIGSVSVADPWPEPAALTQNEASGNECLLSRYRKRGAQKKDTSNA